MCLDGYPDEFDEVAAAMPLPLIRYASIGEAREAIISRVGRANYKDFYGYQELDNLAEALYRRSQKENVRP